MVQIIKKGKVQEKVYKHTCMECSTQFSFKRSEARLSPADPRDQRERDSLAIACPLCGHGCWNAV